MYILTKWKPQVDKTMKAGIVPHKVQTSRNNRIKIKDPFDRYSAQPEPLRNRQDSESQPQWFLSEYWLVFHASILNSKHKGFCLDVFPLEREEVMIWEHFPHHRPFGRGSHQPPVASTHEGSVIQIFDILFMLIWASCIAQDYIYLQCPCY